jgi:dihydroorotase
MNILLKQAKIIDHPSPFNGKMKDIFIENGYIKAIEDHLSIDGVTEVSSSSLHVSLGWVDIKSSFGDPGFEHKETIESGLDTAASGGFTHVFTLPTTHPICDNKTIVEYQLTKAFAHTVQLHPMGSITKGMNGNELAELHDMMQAGVRLFSDDTHSLNAGMLHRVMLYAKNVGAKVCLTIRDEYLAKNAVVNEGNASTRTGMKADPSISEVLQLEKIIRLLEYTESSAHISGVSCKESIDLIKNAKKKGISITCDVNLMNVIFTEDDVLNFDNLMKVLPVLRTKEDKTQIIAALEEGVIDVIASDHRPVDAEEKELEFDHAAFGCFQLQTVFSALNTYTNIPLETLINLLSARPRSVGEIETSSINIGQKADLTLFDPIVKNIFSKDTLVSRHAYSPFLNKSLNGKVVGIIRGADFMLLD